MIKAYESHPTGKTQSHQTTEEYSHCKGKRIKGTLIPEHIQSLYHKIPRGIPSVLYHLQQLSSKYQQLCFLILQLSEKGKFKSGISLPQCKRKLRPIIFHNDHYQTKQMWGQSGVQLSDFKIVIQLGNSDHIRNIIVWLRKGKKEREEKNGESGFH